MFCLNNSLNLLIIAFFVTNVLSEDLGGLGGGIGGGPNDGEENECGKGKHKHHKKMMMCMKQTKDLHESCCPFPKDTLAKEDPMCKEHLEGIEEKEGKEKHKSMKCWIDCMYKSKGLIEGNDLKEENIMNAFDEMLTKLDGDDFKAISEDSIKYCYAEFKKKQEKWDKWAKSWNKTENADGEEKKCNFKPLAFTMCILGNVVRNCPESQWKNTEECNALKANTTSMEDCMKH